MSWRSYYIARLGLEKPNQPTKQTKIITEKKTKTEFTKQSSQLACIQGRLADPVKRQKKGTAILTRRQSFNAEIQLT